MESQSLDNKNTLFVVKEINTTDTPQFTNNNNNNNNNNNDGADGDLSGQEGEAKPKRKKKKKAKKSAEQKIQERLWVIYIPSISSSLILFKTVYIWANISSYIFIVSIYSVLS